MHTTNYAGIHRDHGEQPRSGERYSTLRSEQANQSPSWLGAAGG